jgi:hypothetical protein
MPESNLEDRVSKLERTLEDVKQQLDALGEVPNPKSRWWERIGNKPMTAEEQEAFDAMVEYGRYYRRTGKEPPPDWKPGDPIPEPEFEE